MPSDPVYSPETATEYFKEWGIHDANPRWVQSLCERGELACTIIKRKRRIAQSEIDRYMKRQIKRAS